MNENLDEDYLTRARAAEYVLNGQQDTSMDVGQMQYLAKLLNVDEVHVIDENGFIVCSSVSQYIGIDMDDHEQTRAFLALLDSREEEPYLIQDAMPNAAENKVMKYVGVGRKGMKGIVQVGFEPIRQLELESRNTYEYIFSKFPTDVGEELFVVDRETGAVLGHSDGMEGEFGKEHYRPDILLGSLDGRFIREDNGSIIYGWQGIRRCIDRCCAARGDLAAETFEKCPHYIGVSFTGGNSCDFAAVLFGPPKGNRRDPSDYRKFVCDHRRKSGHSRNGGRKSRV